MSKAREYALEAHGSQKYGSHPYSYHLDAVAGKVEVFKEHLNLADQETAITLAYLHDTVEDTSTSLESIEAHFGRKVAECVSMYVEEAEVFLHALEGKIPAPIMKAMKEQIQEASEILDKQKPKK